MVSSSSQVAEAAMEDVLQRIELKIDAMGGRLEVVEGDISSVKVTLRTITNDLSDVKTDLSGVKTDLHGVKTDLGGVKTDLSGLIETVHRQGVIQEAMRDDIKQTLEGVVFLRESTGRRFDEVVAKLDERVQPVESRE
jgi:archaellum component FlaC